MSSQHSHDQQNRFHELFLKNYRGLFQLGFGVCRQRDLTRDTLQSFYVNMVEKEVWTREVHDLKAYLFRSFYRQMVTELKAQSRRNNSSFVEGEEHYMPFEEALIASQDQLFLQTRLKEATEALPEQQRKVLLLKFRDGMDYEEIAEITGRSSQTIYNQVHQAIVKLRRALTEKKE
ncbi:MAG: sigma-70 family RNA polymerase sigma factor [Bacteroidia bacterium]|nr:sigma-70 family RNA polymerase sigma factor [Bacteroidia bacterium]